MRQRVKGSLGAIGFLLLVSACASHAPSVECDKRLAPINVGETPTGSPLNKGSASAARPKS
jgi:hypothetical protein